MINFGVVLNYFLFCEDFSVVSRQNNQITMSEPMEVDEKKKETTEEKKKDLNDEKKRDLNVITFESMFRIFYLKFFADF